MWLKVCKKSDCYLLPEVLAKFRRGRSGSVSSHGIMMMIGWHYKLWHEAERSNTIASFWMTGVNLIFGFYKKIKYVNNIKHQTEMKNNKIIPPQNRVVNIWGVSAFHVEGECLTSSRMAA